ncbi:MAG TPA: aminopeptidase P N-terminal domain-containing protein [Longimicrobiales bacterium]|nr:aminopeptidase P N-terminal domain-containing protein [Longimicrobiales bacterium]
MSPDARDVYAGRRARVLGALGDGAMVLPAAPEVRIGRDQDLPYRVDPDLYYLTGYTEPEAVAVLTPGTATPFTLFVRPRDPDREVWTGRRGGLEAAREEFGADQAFAIAELPARLAELLAGYDTVYGRFGGGREEVEALLRRILVEARRTRPRKGRGPQALVDPGRLLDDMRLLKDAHELRLMREAAAITAAAFREAALAIRPGAGEWEVQAALDAGFRRRGAEGPAFETIVGSGENAAVLHYVQNDRRMADGELLLVDAGALHGRYAADITRVFPVSGRFSGPQRALYDVVLAAHDAAIAAARPGAPFDAIHEAAARVLVTGLVDLGVLAGEVDALLADEAAYRPYFPHRTSHWLGLDVHDVGDYARGGAARRLEPGMVLTVEPGLYIAGTAMGAPEALRGVGIRIEDDVLVTVEGPEVLTGELPAAADAMAALVAGA